tara:strand:+ start:102 stop:707 length:606 start_codon:yes stop_codon:yes gene_type:complete
MIFEKYLINFPILKNKFKNHSLIQKDLLKLLSQSKDSSLYNDKDSFNDRFKKTDWPDAGCFDRPWVTKIFPYLQFNLNEFAKYLGYKEVMLNKIWYQQYENNNIHNWHIHGDNFSGVYYLSMPKKNKTAFTQFIYPDNLEKSFLIEAEEGDLIFFPSFLIHRAPALQASTDKIIISWNLNANSIQDKFTNDREKVEILKCQ